MSDPKRQIASQDIRPIVAPPSGNGAVWVFAAVAALSASLLFYTLEARRSTSSVAAISAPSTPPSSSLIASPPDIQVPSFAGETAQEIPSRPQLTNTDLTQPTMPRRARSIDFPVTMPPVPTPYAPPMPPASRQSGGVADGAGPSVVFNASAAGPSPSPGNQTAAKQGERVSATRFENPSTTIPLGTVIQAVLETALDSNRAGFARALVSKDIFGFDGTRILVPKGSRLIGEYKTDLGAGQNRALIQWQRLMRPDGVIIDLDSPSADPLGRAGIRGKVDGHFLERFGGAILQSALDIGVQLAAQRAARNTVVVALPETTTSAAPAITPEKVQRTLTVKQGTSVSVFVTRDLDFTSVAQ